MGIIGRFTQKMRDRLKDRSFLFFWLIGAAFYLIPTLAHISHYDFNVTSLIRFGHYYIEQNEEYTPVGAIRFLGNEENGGNGYDGQIFYYYADSLFFGKSWPLGFNNAYRAPRVGYPFLVAIFSVFGPWGTVFGMIFVQLALLSLAAYLLYRMLEPDNRYLMLFFILSPFSLQSYLVLVSDSVMISLVIVGYYFYNRMEMNRNEGKPVYSAMLWSFVAFSLAILTKEPSLFFLFPLGLLALFRRNIPGILLMLGILIPMVLWQFYLREVHGMVPAGVLKIFLSPLDGVMGLGSESLKTVGAFLTHPSSAGLKEVIKLSARILLVLLILSSVIAIFSGRVLSRFLPVRLGALFVLMSVLIADHYYFWSVYENISRMFTLLIPLHVLMKNEDESSIHWPVFLTMTILTGMVLFRTSLLTPVFPHDAYHPYTGPDYSQDTPVYGTQSVKKTDMN